MKSELNKVRFGDIAKFRYGKIVKPMLFGKYPVYSGYKYTGFCDEYNTEPNTIVVVARGVGGTGDVKLTKEKCYLTNLSIAVDLTSEITFSKYLYYYFRLHNLRYLDSGSAQSQITISDLQKLEITLPPLPTQQKIAAILSALDAKIENNNAINRNLEQQAQAIFKSWFVDFEPFGGKMPEGWRVGQLGGVYDIVNGYPFQSKELLNFNDGKSYHVFKQGHINRGGGFKIDGTKNWYPLNKAKNLVQYVLRRGDVLMATTDMKDNVAILGNTALMPFDDRYILNQRVVLIRQRNDINMSYSYAYLLTNNKHFLEQLRQKAHSGVQVNLSIVDIRSLEIVIPDKNINLRFDGMVKPFLKKIMDNVEQNTRLAALRDTLLPKLMSGEIEV